MNPEAIDRELRLRMARRDAMLACLLPQQRALILDTSLTKASLCTRRAGKSWANGTALFLGAQRYEACSCLYLGLTRETARRIMNKDIMRVLNDKFRLGARWIAKDNAWVLPNGSTIYMQGADANKYEMAKIVGQKYRVAVLDEASKYRQNLRELVYGSLLPAMGDDEGVTYLSGTPSNVTTGLFFDVTKTGSAGWPVYSWTWRDNTFKRDAIQKLHDKLVADNPGIVQTPIYRQEWQGEWVVDLSALAYRFSDVANTIDALPRPWTDYTYVLGGDLGFTDPTALVIGAYSRYDPTLYIVYAEKRAKQTITDVAHWVGSLRHTVKPGWEASYPWAAMVFDAASLQAVEEMRQRHHLPLEAAKKTGKHGVIEAMNAELQTGRVKLLPGTEALAEEWGALIWDEKKLAATPKRWEEDPRFANHLADAALYMWRKARNYDASAEPAPEPQVGTEEYHERMVRQEIASLAQLRQTGGVTVDELPPWAGEG